MKPSENTFLYLLLTLILINSGCEKTNPAPFDDFHCDDAELCVKNVGTTTIRYSFGSSVLDREIGPGESACTNVGEVYKETKGGIESTSYPVVTFNSDHGNFAIQVDECRELKEID